MTRSSTALLLSALVFPGAGHMYLKRKGRALLFIVPTLVAAGIVTVNAYKIANEMMDQILAGSMSLDPVVIASRLSADGHATFLLNMATYVIVACWFLAMVDAWLLARPPKH